jgi:DNA-binding CsgD family transcriptional regulator
MVSARQLKRSRMAAGRLLSQACRLTATEADLAQALQNGHSLVGWARRRKVSVNTVYTQLRELKKKIGAHRLPELIRKRSETRCS